MNLDKYNKKRNFNVTNEPIGKIKKNGKKLIFVVQHHIARKDHYDFRLEWNGVLKSWAVPKGLSYNTKDKRLAIRVEDHPFSYRNFEGVIPKGEYGGGTVMVFDTGEWLPVGTPNFKDGPIKLFLKGKRFYGGWSLVLLKENNWILIKEKDKFVKEFDITKINTSIKTGRTMDEITYNITNPDKIIIDDITKLDIVKYYDCVMDYMLPFIQNRLISTIRAPKGIDGDIFFMKHLNSKSKGIGKKYLINKENKKEDYYFIKNKDGLLSEVQMNSFEFHIWGCLQNDINHPDMMVFDLDPDESISLKKIRDGVRDLKAILDDFNLRAYLKTSGGKGYHIVVFFKEKITWDKFSKIAKDIALLMENKWPNKYTTNSRLDKRVGKIYVDFLRNKKGATSVAPYSIRIRKNAPVSMPIAWSDLNKIKPDQITLKKAINIVNKPDYQDPWSDLFDNT